jgi:hypothetical protein
VMTGGRGRVGRDHRSVCKDGEDGEDGYCTDHGVSPGKSFCLTMRCHDNTSFGGHKYLYLLNIQGRLR